MFLMGKLALWILSDFFNARRRVLLLDLVVLVVDVFFGFNFSGHLFAKFKVGGVVDEHNRSRVVGGLFRGWRGIGFLQGHRLSFGHTEVLHQ